MQLAMWRTIEEDDIVGGNVASGNRNDVSYVLAGENHQWPADVSAMKVFQCLGDGS